MWKVALLSVGLLAAPTSTNPAEGYVCTAKKATGFAFNKVTKEWNTTTFNANQSYAVTPNPAPAISWEVREVGNPNNNFHCANGFDGAGWLDCRFLGRFKMNKKTLRFTLTSDFGYAEPYPFKFGNTTFEEGSETPHMVIGVCSPF